jgi:hypothetical protein
MAITSELIREFNDVIDLRGDRISHSKQRIPTPVWGISLASSILWVAPFYALSFKNDLIAIILEGGVTAIVVAILVIIKDLDDPFEGTWKINVAEWELLGEKIKIKPTLFFVYGIGSSRIYKVLAFVNNIFSQRLCPLYSLLNGNNEQKKKFEELEGLAYLRIYYKDQFEAVYEEQASLPAVIYKSGYEMKPILDRERISNINTVESLKELIFKELVSLRKSENGNR